MGRARPFADRPRSGRAPLVPGLAARALAMRAVDGVLSEGAALEDAFESASLEIRDLALARMIAGTAMRRFGSIGTLLERLLSRGMPRKSGPLEAILVTAAAQILFLDVPDHAVVDLAVRLARADDRAQAFSGLANAVLRRVAVGKAGYLAALTPRSDTPLWLFERWKNAYGENTADAIIAAQRVEPPLDISVKSDAEGWAKRLGGIVLPTGSVRLADAGSIPNLEGFGEGHWWVQDAAAALPARLFGSVEGLRVADLCAAPGGKTAQLAVAGAKVTALDRSDTRLARLQSNMKRLNLKVETVCADLFSWRAEPFDAVLLDAPCMATGTIRRHPDIAWSKRAADVAALVDLQRRMLEKAAALVRPGGVLVFCTCSLEPEEGEAQMERFLAEWPSFQRKPVIAMEIGGLGEAITASGDLRTLPFMLPHGNPKMAGLDGFFAGRFKRND